MSDDGYDRLVPGERPEDFGALFGDLFYNINYKVAIFLVLIFFILNTDVFITRILGQFSGAVEYDIPTTHGVFIQSMMLAMAYIIIDIMARGGVI